MRSKRTTINALAIRPLSYLVHAEKSGLARFGCRNPDADMVSSAQTTESQQARWGMLECKLKFSVYEQLYNREIFPSMSRRPYEPRPLAIMPVVNLWDAVYLSINSNRPPSEKTSLQSAIY